MLIKRIGILFLLLLFSITNAFSGETKVTSVSAFVKACTSSFASSNGNVVTLKKDTWFSTNFISLSDCDIVLDLKGKSFYTNSNMDLLKINEGATLTIQGAGSVYSQAKASSTIWVNGGTLNISSTLYSKSYEAITVTNGGTVNIFDGADIYTQNSGEESLRVENGSVVFKGGKIRNTGSGSSIKLENGKSIGSLTSDDFKPYKGNQHLSSEELLASSISGEITVKKVYTLTPSVNGKGSFVFTADGVETTWAAEGENIVIKPSPEKGYKVLTLPLAFEMPAADKTFEVRFERENYSIIYENMNTGDANDNPSTFHVESGTITLKDPVRSGYKFLGWYDNDEHSNRITEIVSGSTGSKTLYAYWSQIYSIKYVLNEGTIEGDYPTSFIKEDLSQTLSLPIPKRTSFKFGGWYTNGEFTGDPVLNVNSSGNKTYYAKWLEAFPIICYWNDGTASKWETAYNADDAVPLPTEGSRLGYTFMGWYDNSACTGSPIKEVPKGSSGEKKYYAKWEINHYNIQFHFNDGVYSGYLPDFYTVEESIELPIPERSGYIFKGWYISASFEGQPISVIKKNTTGNKVFYAKWSLHEYTITLNTQMELVLDPFLYTVETNGVQLPKRLKRNGYTFSGWYKDQNCTQPFGETISKGTKGDFTLYAKWAPIQYTIEYNTYSDVKVPSSTYTIEQEMALPVPQRDAYSFVGWYESDRLEGDAIMTIAKETTGNKKLYAKWSAGSRLNMSQAANGTFTVKNGDKVIKSGDYVGPKTKLTLTATPVSPYTLSKWVIDGKEAGSDNPTTVEMPATNGLAISAIFVDNRTAATAPDIITDPVNTERVPKGESVKVKLSNKDASATLYYSVDGATDKEYEGEFLVASHKDTLQIKAIARKSGFKDGVTTRQVIFDNSKITLTFNLPLGVKAVNPSGGEVVTATTTGGSFEFELKVDREYYTNLDSMVVSANDSVIKAGSAGLYTLTNCTSDVTVTVSGLKAKVCNVTLQQTDNGTISFTDGAEETTMEVEYGASVSVTAKADEDFKFLQWSTGSQSNPLKLTVDKDTTISARFINDYKAYAITLPQLEGVTVKPFTGYSTEVKKDGTFKFYLKLADGYREENPVVRANGEVLAKNKGGYAIYKVNKNISISVEGIVRESVTMKVPGNVNAKVVETMSNASKQEVYEETMILLHAEAPAGKIFDKWTDGKTDNPRMVPAVDAEQLHPLFTNKGDANYAKVILNQSPGAGITAVNANIDGVKTGETVQLNVVLLPAYSQSEVTLTVDGEVLKPSVSLRAASETKTYMYSLPVKKDEITVKVSGMKLNTYNVSLAQTDGGVVYSNPAGTATHGDKIQLKAQPEPGMLFVKWWDGNTLNPYPYTVTADTEVKASFLGAESTVDNESIRKDDPIEITTDGNRLSIKVDKEYQVYIYNFGGGLYQKRKIPAGGYSMYLPSGEYLIKVGDKVDKVIIR